MKGRVIFLLEEPSMKILLDGLLPRLLPGWIEGQHFQCVKHEGKSDLDRSIPRKLSAWRIPGDRFVIVRDNDSADCIKMKARLQALCELNGRPETLVRLVCQELESWYVGDLQALALAFENSKLDTHALSAQTFCSTRYLGKAICRSKPLGCILPKRQWCTGHGFLPARERQLVAQFSGVC